MTSITANAGPNYPHSASVRRLAGLAIAWLRRLGKRRPDAPAQTRDWRTLDAHLLADIGETPETARDAAERDPFWRPLGAMGSLFDHQRHSRL